MLFLLSETKTLQDETFLRFTFCNIKVLQLKTLKYAYLFTLL